jgi:uncharacterized membrane protein required for colicin V production
MLLLILAGCIVGGLFFSAGVGELLGFNDYTNVGVILGGILGLLFGLIIIIIIGGGYISTILNMDENLEMIAENCSVMSDRMKNMNEYLEKIINTCTNVSGEDSKNENAEMKSSNS